MGWKPDRLPDLSGRNYVITGANSGIGLEAAKILAGKGARVVGTARSEEKAQAAQSAIRAAAPGADPEFVLLDLADAGSVQSAAARLRELCPRVDALVNNAGIMQTPELRTAEGFELQLATNHLGHFRLGSALFPSVEAAGGRVVPVASIAHKMGTIDLDDLMFTRRKYDPLQAYTQSKLANMLFAFELQRRLEERGSRACAIPCHPGYAATNLQSAGVGHEGGSRFWRWMYPITNALLAQPAKQGSYPLVLAAADPAAKPGTYYGPTAFGDARGPVGESAVADRARDEQVARAFWEKTEELVGPFFP